MNDKEVESLLEASAEEIQVKDFSMRWEEIKERLPKERRKRVSLKHIFAVASAVAAMVLAIVLPIALRPSNEIHYFTLNEVIFTSVSQEDFYSGIDSANLQTSIIQKYEVEEFLLGRASDLTILGGRVAYNNESGESESIYSITFYSSNVLIEEKDYIDLDKEIIINDVTVFYKTETGDLFNSKALFVSDEITYFIEYISLNDDFITFLENLI